MNASPGKFQAIVIDKTSSNYNPQLLTIVIKNVKSQENINPFLPDVPFWSPQKLSENQRYSDIFRGI